MGKTKIKTAVVELPEQKRLPHAEAMAFVLAQRDLQLAQAAQKQVETFLRAQELEAHLALTATRQQLEESKAAVAQAAARNKSLCSKLAAAYEFDWQTSGLDPVTGLIEALPANSPQ